MLECFPPDIALPQSYYQFSCMFRYVARHVDQIIAHRPVPATFYRFQQSHCQSQAITVLDLALWMVTVNLHSVAAFDKINLGKQHINAGIIWGYRK